MLEIKRLFAEEGVYLVVDLASVFRHFDAALLNLFQESVTLLFDLSGVYLPVSGSLVIGLGPIVVNKFHIVGKLDLSKRLLKEVDFIFDVFMDGLYVGVNWLP